MTGSFAKNKTFSKKGKLKDANVNVIGDGYGGTENYAHVDGYGNLAVCTREGVPQHFNGNVGTSPINVVPDGYVTQILVKNPKSNDCHCELFVSFDQGTNFFGIERRGSLAIETEIDSFELKASHPDCAYEILVTAKR